MNRVWSRAACAAIVASIAPVASHAQQARPVLLHRLFQDHAVLQRDRAIPVWGEALPGETIEVSLASDSATVKTDRTGHWRAELAPLHAGGPYDLLVTSSGGGSQLVRDVLVGDVWLCSGQSNMEFKVSQGLNAWGETQSAVDGWIRLLTVSHDASLTPMTEFQTPVRWQVLSPQNVGDFSAACYFMGRDLRASEKVPIGLIDAAWGGTAIDAWRSEAALAADPAARDKLDILKTYRTDPAEGGRRWGAVWEQWWRTRTGDVAGREPWQANAPGDWRQVPSLMNWESWGVPELADHNGILWYRTEVELTADQAARPATLTLGPVDEVDETWVDGVPVGSQYGYEAARAYPIKPGILHAGRNQVVISVLDTYGAGGLVGTPEQRAIRFRDGSSVPLPPPPQWQYRLPPAGLGDPPRAPWESAAGYTSIYNGMIAPLGDYGLRGVAWYQGESDAGAAKGYAAKLASLMRVWRGQFGNPALPFLIVQLSEYGPRTAQPRESGMAQVRDEQRRAVAADPHAALVVTVDLGEPSDVHPANKQTVGHRLARAAHILAYGGSGAASGPAVGPITLAPGAVHVTISGAEGGLQTYSASAPVGFELCQGAAGACRFVDATIAADATVTLHAQAQPGDRVRYCWADSPLCNLYDRAGLPVGPFEAVVH